jgi:hypothetical protein
MTNDNDKLDADDRTPGAEASARGRRSAGSRLLTPFAKRRFFGALLVPLIIQGAMMTAAKPLPAHGRYPREMRVAFMSACEHEAGIADRPLCQCVLSKLEAQYPATKLVEQMDEAARIRLGERLSAQCAPVSQVAPRAQAAKFPQSFRSEFLASCERRMRADLKSVCTCVLSKIEARYPALTSLETLDERARVAALKRLTVECVRPVAPEGHEPSAPITGTPV